MSEQKEIFCKINIVNVVDKYNFHDMQKKNYVEWHEIMKSI